jgi:hypothetical protein
VTRPLYVAHVTRIREAKRQKEVAMQRAAEEIKLAKQKHEEDLRLARQRAEDEELQLALQQQDEEREQELRIQQVVETTAAYLAGIDKFCCMSYYSYV